MPIHEIIPYSDVVKHFQKKVTLFELSIEFKIISWANFFET